jgi:hypothetical protein
MTHVKTVIGLLVLLLVLPAVACGAFLQVCDCERITHTVVSYCEHCEHDHEAPVEHHCQHEDYLLQSVNTQVEVPVCPLSEAMGCGMPVLLSCELGESSAVVTAPRYRRRWGPPDEQVLPLLI